MGDQIEITKLNAIKPRNALLLASHCPRRTSPASKKKEREREREREGREVKEGKEEKSNQEVSFHLQA